MRIIIELDDIIIENIKNKDDEITITIKEHNYFGDVNIEELKLALRRMTAK
jgi:hypothetical protein